MVTLSRVSSDCVRSVRRMRAARGVGAMCAWRLVLLTALPALVGGGAGEVVVASGDAPEFLPTRRNLVVPPGGDVTLVCRVARLGDKAVSWVRGRDLQILAHAGQAFAADPRVSADWSSVPGVATHTLTLASLRVADAGRYECQLNTDPKLSLIYNLTVTEDAWRGVEVRSLGPGTTRAPIGGTATLGCSARLQPEGVPDPPALRLTWYRDGEPLLPQSGRALGGVGLETERAAGRVTSRLTLGTLAPADAGPYVCHVTVDPGEGDDPGDVMQGEVALTLIVTEHGELGEMEAMQRDQSAPGGSPPPPLLPLVLLLPTIWSLLKTMLPSVSQHFLTGV